MGEPRFVADAMLGRLARWLRALGYDTLYFRDAPDRRLLAVALADQRRLLTRDAALARRAREAGLLVRAETLDAQIHEVTAACGLVGQRALSRCLECNTLLVRTAPEAVRDRVPPTRLRRGASSGRAPAAGASSGPAHTSRASGAAWRRTSGTRRRGDLPAHVVSWCRGACGSRSTPGSAHGSPSMSVRRLDLDRVAAAAAP